MIIVIVGPTGVGKTKLSIELAKRLNGEIINADSTQVYKGLDIATAKITNYEGIKHHLLDIKEISEDYNVYDFQKDGRKIIDDLLSKEKTVIIVGGTGLYLKALLYDYQFKDEPVITKYDSYTNDELFSLLMQVDKQSTIHKNNRKRIIRSLNYYDLNGKPFSEKEKTVNKIYQFEMIGLTTNRDNLYEIINKRVDQMIETGLIEEAYGLYQTKLRTKSIMTPIGYKELFQFFDGLITKEEAIALIKKNTRNYAKRQYTWFNNQMEVKWFNVDYNNFNLTIEEVYNYIKKRS